MRILLVSRGFNKHGGISRYVAELAEKFVREHEIHLLTTKYDYKVANLIVHKKPMIEKPFWLQIASNAYYNTKYAKKLKEKFDIDVVNSNGAESWKCDVVTMHSCHKAWNKYYRSWDPLRNVRGVIDPLNIVVLAVERRVLEKGSKKIIAVSEGVKREILENYNVPEEKIAVVPSGVDLEEFKPNQKKREEIRKRYNINDNEIVLMFSGYEFKRKGLEYIIKALPKINNKNIKLLVVGGDDAKRYKLLASRLGVLGKIIFVGTVKKGINSYYAASDIFLFPTAYEAFSLATLEAVASGLPILATKVNGTEELIKDGYNGFFINRDPTDIAEKVNVLVEDENLRKQMSRNARRTAEKYSWDEVAKKTMEVYEEVARR